MIKKDEKESNEMWYREICLIIGNYRVIIKGESIDLTQKEYENLKRTNGTSGRLVISSRSSF